MQFTSDRIDIVATLAQRPLPPTLMIERAVGDTWLIAHSALAELDKPIEWRKSIRGETVPMPLFAYAMSPDMDTALAFMAQIGARAALSLNVPIARLHLAIGTPVLEKDLDNDAGVYWQYWLGFAMLVQR